MLQEFPAEIPIPYVPKPAPQLEGFEPEAPVREAVRVLAAPVKTVPPRDVAVRPRRKLATPVMTVAASAVAAVVIATSWRPVPATATNASVPARPQASSVVLPVEQVERVEPAAQPVPLAAAPVNIIAESRTPVARAARPAPPPVVVRPTVVQSAMRSAAPVPAVFVAPPSTATARIVILQSKPELVERKPEVPERAEMSANFAAAVIDETPAIEEVLRRYQAAYERLDAAAAKQIWPSLDERALAKAFAGLSSQTLTLRPCRIDVKSANATAACRGFATYVARVGNKAGRIQRRDWTFMLEKSPAGWQIGNVQSN